MKGYVLAVAFAVCFVLAIADPLPNELKEFNEKLAEAKKALADAKKYLASDYIQNFATILESGVEKLHETTLAQLKTTTDQAKRQEIITYAVKAYTRLVKFLDEIKNTVQ
ncbi:hypothetical protein TYRP_015753 [Tyrophagus putrescentiae]|nr:hypothetical protein TYRP_015753 [Tyrophagus putrescentiae]